MRYGLIQKKNKKVKWVKQRNIDATLTIEIDECFRNIKCEYCFKLIERKTKYYFDKPNTVLLSSDVCKECSYKHKFK